MHEAIEAYLCKQAGVSQAAVDRFDQAYERRRKPGDESEPGNDPKAPYDFAHVFATKVERMLAGQLGINGGLRWRGIQQVKRARSTYLGALHVLFQKMHAVFEAGSDFSRPPPPAARFFPVPVPIRCSARVLAGLCVGSSRARVRRGDGARPGPQFLATPPTPLGFPRTSPMSLHRPRIRRRESSSRMRCRPRSRAASPPTLAATIATTRMTCVCAASRYGSRSSAGQERYSSHAVEAKAEEMLRLLRRAPPVPARRLVGAGYSWQAGDGYEVAVLVDGTGLS